MEEEQNLLRELLREPKLFREVLSRTLIDRWFSGFKTGFILALIIVLVMYLIAK